MVKYLKMQTVFLLFLLVRLMFFLRRGEGASRISHKVPEIPNCVGVGASSCWRTGMGFRRQEAAPTTNFFAKRDEGANGYSLSTYLRAKRHWVGLTPSSPVSLSPVLRQAQDRLRRRRGR